MSVERLGVVAEAGTLGAREALHAAASTLDVSISSFEEQSAGAQTLLRAQTPAGLLLTAVLPGAPVVRLGSAPPADKWEPSWAGVEADVFRTRYQSTLDAVWRLPPELSQQFPNDPPPWAVARDDRDAVWVTNNALLVREADATRSLTRKALQEMRAFDGRVWSAILPLHHSLKPAFADTSAGVGCVSLHRVRDAVLNAPRVTETCPHRGVFGPGVRELLRRFPAQVAREDEGNANARAYGFDEEGRLLYVLMPCQPNYVNFKGEEV